MEKITQILRSENSMYQIFPGNKELLYLITEKNWMALLLNWMNQYDRPKVQVEAMLSLTCVTDLCQQQFYQNPPTGVEFPMCAPKLAAKLQSIPIHEYRTPEGRIQTAHNAAAVTYFESIGAKRINTYIGTSASPPNVSTPSPSTSAAIGNNIIQTDILPGSIANRVKNIMNQAKETKTVSVDVNTTNGNVAVKETVTKSVGIEGGKQKTTIIQKTTMVSKSKSKSNTSAVNANTLLSKAIMQSSSTNLEDKQNRNKMVMGSDDSNANNDDTNTTASTTTGSEEQYRATKHMNIDDKQKDDGDQADTRPPAPPPKLCIPYRKGGTIEELMKGVGAQKNVPAMPLPMQNLPPMPTAITGSGNGSGNGSSPIPLVANYSQPLSVTSNNLLVRHPEAIPSFISLMTSPDKDVCENAMWVVGNIAAGEGTGVPGTGANGSNAASLSDINDKSPSVTVKDIVLAAGAMGPLLRCMERFQDSSSLQRIGCWVISTLVENKLPPGKKSSSNSNSNSSENSRIEDIDLDQLLNTIRRVIQTDDDDILSYTCWSLSHLCDGPPSNIAAVVTSPDAKSPPGGIVPRLVELLHHQNWRVTKPALRTIGNIVCAEYDEDAASAIDDKPMLTDFTEVILECNAVPRLKALINHCNREIQKEACWTLSNIAAGTVDQIQAVIDSGAILPLVSLVNDETTDQEVRSEACWVVLNATSCGSDAQIGVLVTEGCVSVLGLLLEETNMVTMALEGLERVLQVEELREAAWRENKILGGTTEPPTPLVSASLIEKALNKNHKSNVTKRAQKIWTEHFVSCALCNQPYSKHRITDAKFCEECKCHVCHNCNCEIYHLSYQEELWATPDEKKSGKSKKNKNKKKKEKRKERNKMKAQESKVLNTEKVGGTQISSDSNSTNNKKNVEHSNVDATVDAELSKHNSAKQELATAGKDLIKAIVRSDDSDLQDDFDRLSKKVLEKVTIPTIDYNLYLQETGSIIAVSNLMDALDHIQDIRNKQ